MAMKHSTTHKSPPKEVVRLQRTVTSLRSDLKKLALEQKHVREELDLLRTRSRPAAAHPLVPAKWRKGLWKKHAGKLSQAGADRILAAVEECCERLDMEDWD